MIYEPRRYRNAVSSAGLIGFEVMVNETDLQVLACRDLSKEATALAVAARTDLERYIRTHPRFAESYSPVPVDSAAPPIVLAMADASERVGVGPMAAVAGAIAEFVARGLARLSAEVIVENGGDVFLIGSIERSVGLWAGDAGVAGVGIRLDPERMPCAVATSSGRIGHSESFGSADSVTIIATDGALADAVATATANRVRSAADVQAALDFARDVTGVDGALIAVEGALAAWGEVELVPLGADLA